MKPIPYGHQHIGEADIAEVVKVLRSDWITQGPAIKRFEDAVAHYCGARHAVAVANGTAGLHLAALALGANPGDLLWTSPITFTASANCARYCGADVDFVDIDPETSNLSLDVLERKLVRAKAAGRLPKILVPVHYGGQPCDMIRVGELARRYGFHVIEDAAHAIGSSFRGVRTGACRDSDMTVFSFHPVKVMTTGEGGMILTNRDVLYERLLMLRTHGITRDPAKMAEKSQGPWYYEQIELGFNYRMTDIQAALGWSQLQRLDEFVARRHALAKRYDQLLSDLPLRPLRQHPDAYSSLHLYVVRLDRQRTNRTHQVVFSQLLGNGIEVNLHYIPVYRHPYYRSLGYEPREFPEAENHYAEAITLPLYFDLGEREQERVVESLRQALA